MKSETGSAIRVTTRSLAGVRETLLQELDDLRNGKATAEQAKTVAMLAAVALKTVEVQLKYAQLVNSGALKPGEQIPQVPLIEKQAERK